MIQSCFGDSSLVPMRIAEQLGVTKQAVDGF